MYLQIEIPKQNEGTDLEVPRQILGVEVKGYCNSEGFEKWMLKGKNLVDITNGNWGDAVSLERKPDGRLNLYMEIDGGSTSIRVSRAVEVKGFPKPM